jgi:GNAT superfamily N-acetyltransferase
MPTVRAADLAGDRARIARIDTSFQTDRIYRVTADPAGFRLDEEPVDPPRTKAYPVANEDLGEGLVVAEDEGELVGFGEVVLEAWNRRATIAHLYVAPSSRGTGVGTALLAALERRARAGGARCLWLETQNINYPAPSSSTAGAASACAGWTTPSTTRSSTRPPARTRWRCSSPDRFESPCHPEHA